MKLHATREWPSYKKIKNTLLIHLRMNRYEKMNYHLSMQTVQCIREEIDGIERLSMDAAERFSLDQFGWKQLMNMNVDDFVIYDFYKSLLHRSAQEMIKEMTALNSRLAQLHDRLKPVGMEETHSHMQARRTWNEAQVQLRTWEDEERDNYDGTAEEKKSQ